MICKYILLMKFLNEAELILFVHSKIDSSIAI